MKLHQGFFAWVISHPVGVSMIFIAMVIFGTVSYSQLSLNLMPSLTYPTMTVRTAFPGAAPEEVEAQVSRPIEESLSTINGMVDIESRSRAESSDVVLEFRWDADLNEAAQSIRERLQTSWLPEETERPLLLRYDPSQDPILRVGLAMREGSELDGEQALLTLRALADEELKPSLEALDGVAAARVQGGLEREIRVSLREDWMAARETNPEQVAQTLRAGNVNLAGGSIREGDTRYLIRTLNEIQGTEGVAMMNLGEGSLEDVAEIVDGHKERQLISRLNGSEAVDLALFKEADANLVQVARRLLDRMGLDGQGGGKSLRELLPEEVQLVRLDDQAQFIESALNNLRQTALLGGGLAVAVLFLFLSDLRATFVIATAIPTSIVCAFAGLYLGGVSLNLMSLGGLALGMGMLVDNAVVVLEAIEVRRKQGASAAEAALQGTRDVAGAVLASTLTTVAVFAPIIFVEGIAGQIFGDLAAAVVFSLLASLVSALILVPMLAARQLSLPGGPETLGELTRPLQTRSRADFRASWEAAEQTAGLKGALSRGLALLRLLVQWPMEKVALLLVWPSLLVFRYVYRGAAWLSGRIQGGMLRLAERFQQRYQRLARYYPQLLTLALRNPSRVLSLALLSLALGLMGLRSAGQTLLPEVNQGRFEVVASMPIGTPLEHTQAVLSEIESELMQLPEVENLHAVIGSLGRTSDRADEGEHMGRIQVFLRPGGDLEARQRQVMEQVRATLQDWPELEFQLETPALFTFKNPVEVAISGPELEVLRSLSDEALVALREVEGVTDWSSSMSRGYPEIRVRYRRDLLQRFQLNASQVATSLRDRFQGVSVGRVMEGERRVDLKVQLHEEERNSLEDLRQVQVHPDPSIPLPLGAIAELEEGEGPAEIRRIGHRRAAVISAQLEGADLSEATEGIEQALASLNLPPGYSVEITGQAQEMSRSLASLLQALGLASFLVYAIMASSFESLLQPLILLGSLPLALTGVGVVLWILGIPVSVVVGIGVIVLAGVVVNNAIVLVDWINRLQAEGMERAEAILQAGKARLRPILITTSTTALGLLPLAFGLGEGAEIQQPLAVTLIAGLISSTLLTLIVIPVLLDQVMRWREGLGARA